MNTIVFESKILPDGHLHCPEEFVSKKNVRFKVIAIIETSEISASDNEIEQASIMDASDEYLSEEELQYYLDLEELS